MAKMSQYTPLDANDKDFAKKLSENGIDMFNYSATSQSNVAGWTGRCG